MEQLPLEMVAHILGYLDLDDLANCRLVCKNFLTATNHVKISEVVLNKSCDRKTKPFWFSIKSPKYNEDPISLKQFLTYKTIFNFESQLKRLHLNNSNPGPSPGSSFTFNHDIYTEANIKDCHLFQLFSFFTLKLILNGLRQLKQLEILSTFTLFRSFRERGRCEIDLPSLEIFVLDGLLDFSIELNAPRLRILKTSSMDRIQIREPNSVKRIHTSTPTGTPVGLNSFLNLECLFLELREMGEEVGVGQFQLISEELMNLHNLKSLHLMLGDWTSSSTDFEALKRNLKQLRHRRTAKGQEFRVYFQGVELVPVDKIDKIDELELTTLGTAKFQFENSDILQEDMSDFGYFPYNCLMKLCENDLPPRFFEKYAINDVQVSGETDLKLLVNFLNSLKFLNSLCLGPNAEVNLDSLLEQLNAPLLNRLKCLRKMNLNAKLLKQLYLKILKFKALSFLHTEVSFGLELAWLFRRLKNLVSISFNLNGVPVSIEKKHFFDRFYVELGYVGNNKYAKVCFYFGQIFLFCNLAQKRKSVSYWIKFILYILYLGWVCLKIGWDFLFSRQVDPQWKFFFRWNIEMLLKFIFQDTVLKNARSRDERRLVYLGPLSELIYPVPGIEFINYSLISFAAARKRIPYYLNYIHAFEYPWQEFVNEVRRNNS